MFVSLAVYLLQPGEISDVLYHVFNSHSSRFIVYISVICCVKKKSCAMLFFIVGADSIRPINIDYNIMIQSL